MDFSRKDLPNFNELSSLDGVIRGKHNKVTSVNPYWCHFIATYPDGKEVEGVDLFTTGWDQIPQGLSELRYELSTGHVIRIPKYKAYMPMIECSIGMDNSRIFHFINVKCLAEKEVIVYKIVLRQDGLTKAKIGDIIMSREPLPKEFSSSWKFTN